MVISASNLVLYHQQNTPDLALATYEDLLIMPEAREQLHLVSHHHFLDISLHLHSSSH